MTHLSSVQCVGLTFLVIVTIVLAYDWYQNHSSEVMTRVRAAKKAVTTRELEQFLSASSTQAAYDPASTGLEQSIVDSHREFTDEAYQYAQGANSTDVLLDHEENVNPRWGLRRIDYSVGSGSDARTVSSETPSQMKQGTGSFVL